MCEYIFLRVQQGIGLDVNLSDGRTLLLLLLLCLAMTVMDCLFRLAHG